MKEKISIVLTAIRKIATNKYLLTCAFAAIWFLFIDDNTLISYYKLKVEEQRILREIAYYKNLSEESQKKMSQLETDQNSLEEFAREQFLMKRDDEDIFLVEE